MMVKVLLENREIQPTLHLTFLQNKIWSVGSFFAEAQQHSVTWSKFHIKEEDW